MNLKNQEKYLIRKGIPPVAARLALNQDIWKKWLGERESELNAQIRMHGLGMVAGKVVDSGKWDRNVDQETLIECYETYLRMAQMHQRSQVSFITEFGKRIGKPVIDMTFDEYLRDCLKNLDWRIKKELPSLYRLAEKGGLGISKNEMELSTQICEATKEAINKYFELSEDKRLIYI